MLEKKYITISTPDQYLNLFKVLSEAKIVAIDTETNSLNPRTGKIIGASFSTKIGEGFYLPTLIYNPKKDILEDYYISEKVSGHDALVKLLNILHGKKLIAHNASFDFRFIKAFYKIDLLDSLWVDTALLVHTVQEDGAFGFGTPFALKSIAKSIQQEIGLDVEKAANEEQIILKESIKKNGGSVTRESFEIYKADLEILSEYAAADTDLTLRICKHFLSILAEEGLEDFFFKDEVMPLYKTVTIPMEELGVRLDMDLLRQTSEEIQKDLIDNKRIVIDSLMQTEAAQQWVISQSLEKFPPKNRGSYAERFVEVYKEHIPLPLRKGTQTYDIRKKAVEELPDNLYTGFLKDPDNCELRKVNFGDLLKISLALWKESNDGEWFNIQSKKHMGQIVFDYMKIEPLSKTKKGADQFDDSFVEHLSQTHDWAEKLRQYNKLVKINSTYVERFLSQNEDGRYYFYYKQNGTVSGRYGSDAQQLPKPKEDGEASPMILKYNNRVRQFMIADEGRVFIDCDYESLEPHCVDPESLVWIESMFHEQFLTRIDDVYVGDFIMTKAGKRKVLNKWESEKETIILRTNRGTLKVSPDHKIHTNDGWIRAEELKEGDELEDVSKAFFQKRTYIKNRLPVHPSKPYELRKPLGYRAITEEEGWITGALLGDGMIQDGVVGIVGLKSDPVIKRFYNYFDQFGYNVHTVDESDTVRQYRISSRDVHSFVKHSLGIVDKKTGKKLLRVPKWIFSAGDDVQIAFLAGLLDTDGTVSKKGNEATISTKSDRFATDIISLGKQLGLDFRMLTSFGKDEKKHCWHTVRITLHDLIKLNQNDINRNISCLRKKLVRTDSDARSIVPKTYIKSIERGRIRRMIDITVEGEEEFVMDGFRVHNCFADVSSDKGLQEIFTRGHDFYSTIAIKTEGLKNVSADKDADNFLKKVDPVKRNKAKAYSLGIAYGMGDYALAMTLGIPVKEASKLVEGYLSGFPELRKWRENSRKQMKELGYVKSKVGRIRHLRRGKEVYDIFGEKILNWKYKKDLVKSGQFSNDEVTKMYRDLKNALNNCLNFQIQSLAASIVNRAAIAINRECKKRGLDAIVCAQIHDQLIIDSAISCSEEVLKIVQDKMENTTKLSIALKAPPELAYNWYEGH